MASKIREEVNSSIFALVVERIGPAGVTGLDRMLVTAGGPGAKSDLTSRSVGPAAAKQAAALEMARKTVEAAGGFPEELSRIAAVRATHYRLCRQLPTLAQP